MQKQKNGSTFLLGIIQRLFGREALLYHEPVVSVHTSTTMNLHGGHKQEEMLQLEPGMMLRDSCTAEELQEWTRLRDHYQHGGSDRGPVLRHLKFLKLLVQRGKIER
ncbi:MAG: hypothetical protein H0V70_01460 [Ktedonobacteraceae bacterium]|nr:hypothetical protein [Ktedonobacteraceae bacterium]